MLLHIAARLRAPTRMLIAATVVMAVLHPCVAFAQATSGSSGSNCLPLPVCGPGDVGNWLQQTLQDVVSQFLGSLAADFGDAMVRFINDANFLTHTPENLSYNDELVKQLVSATRILANGLLAVVVLVTGYNVMLRPYLGAGYAGTLEVLPRLILGGILVNTAAWWCRLAIDINNAACGVFGAPSMADLISGLAHATREPIAGVLMVLIVVVMSVLLAIQQLMRLALLDVLLILAPLAALLWILPQTQSWARLWGRLFIGTVFAQAIQVLTLRLGFNLATGLPPLTAAGLLQPLLGIAVLTLALKIPSLMSGGAGGGNVVSTVLGTAGGAAVGTVVGTGVRAALGVGTRAVWRPVSMMASTAAVSNYRNGGAWNPGVTRYPD